MIDQTTENPVNTYITHLLSEPGQEERLGPAPYQGLRFFDQQTNQLLFARDAASSQIRERFEREQTVVVVGGSGSGKSSIVRGRVVSEISTQSYPVKGRGGAWYSVVFRPGTRPFDQFLDALWGQIFSVHFRSSGGDSDDFSVQIRDMVFGPGISAGEARQMVEDDLDMAMGGKKELHDGFRAAHSWTDVLDGAYRDAWLDESVAPAGHEALERPAANVLFLIDQFEEIFRNNVDPEQAEKIFAMIRYMHLKKPPGVFLVLTMRSEDLHRCTQVPDLPDLINDSFYLVKWLNREELGEAIVQPARRVLREWRVPMEKTETAPYREEVVTKLLDQVERMKEPGVLAHRSDHLPLFQHGLSELWKTAAEDWDNRPPHEQTGPFEITEAHLNKVMARSETGALWYSGILNKVAIRVLDEAAEIFAGTAGKAAGGVDRLIAIRAALCEMASLEENRRYHREFVRVSEVLDKRFPEIQGAARGMLDKALTKALDHFDKRGLLVKTVLSSGEASYDVIHEALIRNWKALDHWVMVESEIVNAVAGSTENKAIKISDDDMPVLAKICDKPRLSRFVTDVEERYRDTFTENWVTSAIEHADAYQSVKGVFTPKDLFEKVRERWRWKRLVNSARMAAIPFALAIVLGGGVAAYNYSERSKAQQELLELEKLNAVRKAETARVHASMQETRTRLSISVLIALKGGRLEDTGMPQAAAQTLTVAYKAVDHAISHHSYSDKVSREARLRAHSELDALFRRLVGGALHVVSIPAPWETERPPACDQYGMLATADGDPREELAAGGILIRAGGAGEAALEFFHAPTGGIRVPLPVANQRGSLPREFQNNTRICLSPDARMLTVSVPGAPVPFVYRLRMMQHYSFGKKWSPKTPYLAAWQITSPDLLSDVDPELLRGGNSALARVEDIRTVITGPGEWRRDILYMLGETPFLAFFHEGRALPVQVDSGAVLGIEEEDWYSVRAPTAGAAAAMNWCQQDILSETAGGVGPDCQQIDPGPIIEGRGFSRYFVDLPYEPPGFAPEDTIRIEAEVPWIVVGTNPTDNSRAPVAFYSVILRHEYQANENETAVAEFKIGEFTSEGITDIAIKKLEDGTIVLVYRTGHGALKAMRLMEPVADAVVFLKESISTRYRFKEQATRALENALKSCRKFRCEKEILDFVTAELKRRDPQRPKDVTLELKE